MPQGDGIITSNDLFCGIITDDDTGLVGVLCWQQGGLPSYVSLTSHINISIICNVTMIININKLLFLLVKILNAKPPFDT